ncbi:MAG: hypothetical protein H0W44_03155 [Gammaproteobacteria bacterium]|nr:hypothetical protein [Gammaproteobacteria bacterium]
MRQLFYFNGQEMQVLSWQDNTLQRRVYASDETGEAAFRALLRAEVRKPLRILLDISDEDIRVDTMPHVSGRDREDVQRRLLDKHFRDTQLRQLHIQDRQLDGRRDDIVLVSALTQTQKIEYWLTIIEAENKPIQGLYSLPLLVPRLVKSLEIFSTTFLLLSPFGTQAVRQSFYLNGHLKLSRIAALGTESSSGTDVRFEMERSRRFLENQRYINRDTNLAVYVIAESAVAEQWAIALAQVPDINVSALHVNEIAQRLNIPALSPNFETLLAYWLMQDRYAKPHYRISKQRRLYYLYLARRTLLGLSLAFMILATLLCAALIAHGYWLKSQLPTIATETQAAEHAYQSMVNDVSDLKLDVNDVKNAVSAVNDLIKYKPLDPIKTFTDLSMVMTAWPDIQLKSIEWSSTTSANNAAENSQEQLTVEAEITDFKNNPRIAIAKVQQFTQQLSDIKNVKRVQIIKMPFDIAPDTRFSSDGNNRSASAQFSVLIFKGAADE